MFLIAVLLLIVVFLSLVFATLVAISAPLDKGLEFIMSFCVSVFVLGLIALVVSAIVWSIATVVINL